MAGKTKQNAYYMQGKVNEIVKHYTHDWGEFGGNEIIINQKYLN